MHVGEMRGVRWGMEVGLERMVRTICLAVRGPMVMGPVEGVRYEMFDREGEEREKEKLGYERRRGARRSLSNENAWQLRCIVNEIP